MISRRACLPGAGGMFVMLSIRYEYRISGSSPSSMHICSNSWSLSQVAVLKHRFPLGVRNLRMTGVSVCSSGTPSGISCVFMMWTVLRSVSCVESGSGFLSWWSSHSLIQEVCGPLQFLFEGTLDFVHMYYDLGAPVSPFSGARERHDCGRFL